jgi:S1-C subfamily serine protease
MNLLKQLNVRLLKQLSDGIAQAVESVLPSIVEIAGWKTRSPLNPLRFVDDDKFKEVASGAGVVIQSDGVIITNHHVVQGSDRLCVKLQDGRSFEADVCGVDPISDIAVLRVPAKDLPVASLGVDRPVRLGEIILALGHPFGLTSTVTMGIVSTAARFSMNPSGHLPSVYIQTDAAINPGNSGGALVGCDGSVLGINTWGLDPLEGQGVAFAIPISTALRVSTKLLQHGNVAYGTIGVAAVELDLPAQAASKHGLRQVTALLATEIDSDGPAQKAGIQVGDWILAIDDRRIESLETFLEILNGDLIGKSVKVQILRGFDYALAEIRLEVESLVG